MAMHFYTNVTLHKGTIHCWGYGNGKRFHDEIEYRPYLFVPDPEGEFKTIHDEPVTKREFKSVRDARKFLADMEGISNARVYGLTNFTYQFINDEFPDGFKFDPALIHIISLDIEVDSRDGLPDTKNPEAEITAITMSRNGKSITFGTKALTVKQPNNTYVMCRDERDMLNKFLDAWNSDEWYPDIVTGWNIDFFDIPYLINRVARILGSNAVKAFSPIGLVYERPVVRGKSGAFSSKNAEDRVEVIYEMAGITSLDYMALYKKFAMNARESYALGFIAMLELGESKVDYGEYGSLDKLYELNFDKFIEYNIHDATLIERLEAKLNYIQQVFAIAYRAKINYLDTMTTSRPWDAIIHSYLLKRKVVIPFTNPSDDVPVFEGAYVKEPAIGLHHWVVSIDLTSLYPSILSQQNISPDTFLEKIEMPTITQALKKESLGDGMAYAKSKNATLCMNGTMFRRDKRGFIPELVDEFIAERASVKKKMIDLKKAGSKADEIKHLNNYQNALKILTNGLYGALGMKYFRWFDIDHAAAVTSTGQLAIRWIEKKLNVYLNNLLETEGVDYVIASDTDSCYLALDKLVESCGLKGEPTDRIVEFLDKACQTKIEPYIERCYVVLGDMLNVYTLKLKMKREAIANKGIWRGKKMYILNVWNNEGVQYKEPELVLHGIEAVRSSTPMICRDNIKKALKIIMNEDEVALQKFIKTFKDEFMSRPFEDIAFPRSVNNLSDYYDPVLGCRKATPIHVRGAINYNNMLDKLGLTHKYAKIIDKSKIRFAYLREPNPVQSHVIAVLDTMPPEFGLDSYVDRDTQWDKTFLSPIKSITDVIGWHLEKKTTLLSFMKAKN